MRHATPAYFAESVYYRAHPSGETFMARISLIEPAQASPEVKEIYDGKLKGKPGSIQKALAHRPSMLGNFLGFYASVGRSLDRKLYEAVYLRVSLINGCHYCTQHHIQGAKRAGLTAEQMKALKEGNYSGFGAAEHVALRYAKKLHTRPTAPPTSTSPNSRNNFPTSRFSIYTC